jgi:hypothetical protein
MSSPRRGLRPTGSSLSTPAKVNDRLGPDGHWVRTGLSVLVTEFRILISITVPVLVSIFVSVVTVLVLLVMLNSM